jgi:hypothetical protein
VRAVTVHGICIDLEQIVGFGFCSQEMAGQSQNGEETDERQNGKSAPRATVLLKHGFQPE